MHPIILDEVNLTARPHDVAGDEYYGLKYGSNGTAAECRRNVAPKGYTWLQHNGKPAVGLTTIPSGVDDAENPWSGRVSERAHVPPPPRPKIFRLSWEEHSSPADSRPITDPPVEPVLAWWESGQAGDSSYATMVAFVAAETESAAWKAIGESWPEKKRKRRVVRFVHEVDHVESTDRFRVKNKWSIERIAKLMQLTAAALCLLVASGCGPQYSYRRVCDVVTRERVFLECIRAQHGPSTLAAAGNDEAEAIEECNDSAEEIACRNERYCHSNCEAP